MFINLPFRGTSKIPGTELGFRFYLKENLLYKNYYIGSEYLDFKNYEEEVKDIIKVVDDLMNKKRDIVIFGGDHSTTTFMITEILQKYRLPIIIFDAHLDKGYHENKYMNWNVLNSIEDYITKGLIIGCRHYYEEIKTPNIYTVIDDIQLRKDKECDIIDNFIMSINTKDNPYVYVSIDLDVLNPIEFPGVGFTEPGGILLVELISFIREIKKKNIPIIWDIVEFNPLIEKDKSIKVINRLLQEIRDL